MGKEVNVRAGMKNWLLALVLSCGLLVLAAAEADKLYKWTDADGNVHYTDHAPTPDEARTQERKQFGDKPTEVALPYALQRAIKNFPVTFYTAPDCGDACSQAAALLAKRGVPFTEKNARDAAGGEELKALNSGKLEVPLLKLGSQVLLGFEEAGWNQALDAAGYPSTAVVPPKVADKGVKSQPSKPQSPRSPEPGKEEKPAVTQDKPALAPGGNAAQ
jgi:glutaredoxin